MRHSIRSKLFLGITCLIIFYTSLSWILNSEFLPKYYFYIKKKALIEEYKQINSSYTGNPQDISLELEKLESTEGLHIIIMDKNYQTKYDSIPKRRGYQVSPKDHMTPQRKPAPESSIMSEIKSKAQEAIKGNPVVEITTISRLSTDFISLVSVLKNGDVIFMSTPIAAINESAKVSNKFFLFTGIITIIAGSIFVFILTRKYTRPILKLNEIAQSMAMLDFTKKYTNESNDEIGELGKSINSLSCQLEKSISELKEANEKLKEDIERERRIDNMRKEFISSVSHELKTPIALIQGYAEGLKFNVNKDEENKNFYCDVITDEALKMNKLVKQLLDLSQLESGNSQLDRIEFDISLLIEQVLKKNELIFNEKDIKVIFENPGELMVNGDIDRIEQILVNYVNNAVNYVDNNKVIKIDISKFNTKARVSIFNSGQHIPEESLKKVWISFYKVDKARSRSYGGTGLGLSIVRAIQEAHMNGYGVKNAEGGVEFWFDLDLSIDANPEDI